MTIFRNDNDRRAFIRMLVEATDDAGTNVGAYCLVGNHFHLLLHCPDGGLSRTLWKLTHEYARIFNSRHARDGPVFRGRYCSKVVASDDYLCHLVPYIHRNSLDIGVAPGDWSWSSYQFYSGKSRPPGWLACDVPLRIIGGSSVHRAAVEIPTLSEDAVPHSHRDEPSAMFETWQQKTATGRIRSIIHEVEQLHLDRVRRTHLLSLATDGLASQGEVARLVGAPSAAAMRQRIRRAKQRLAVDDEFAAAWQQLSNNI